MHCPHPLQSQVDQYVMRSPAVVVCLSAAKGAKCANNADARDANGSTYSWFLVQWSGWGTHADIVWLGRELRGTTGTYSCQSKVGCGPLLEEWWYFGHRGCKSRGHQHLIWWHKGGAGPHQLFALAVDTCSSGSYLWASCTWWRSDHSAYLESCSLEQILWEEFWGGLLQLVFLLNSDRGEEEWVHSPATRRHDNGRVPLPVPSIGEICISSFRTKR